MRIIHAAKYRRETALAKLPSLQSAAERPNYAGFIA